MRFDGWQLLAIVVVIVAACGGQAVRAQSVLIPNGNFEDGLDHWTYFCTPRADSNIWTEGTNGPFAGGYDITGTRFDGIASGAPDPFHPYQSEADPRLDTICFTRPNPEGDLDSYGAFISPRVSQLGIDLANADSTCVLQF